MGANATSPQKSVCQCVACMFSACVLHMLAQCVLAMDAAVLAYRCVYCMYKYLYVWFYRKHFTMMCA